MSRLSALLAAFALMLAVPLPAGAQQSGPYLFELVDRPAFLAAYKALFSGQSNVDAWIRDYPRTKNGPATPSKTYQIDGRSYVGATVCQTHNCGANRLHILFAPDGSKAVAVQLVSGKRRWFGNPTPAEQAVLPKLD